LLYQASLPAVEGYRQERVVVCALCQSTNFTLDNLTSAIMHFLPYLNRDSI